MFKKTVSDFQESEVCHLTDLGLCGARLFCVYDFSGGRTVDAQIRHYCHETSNFATEKLTNCNLGGGAPVGKRMARKKAERLRRQGEFGLAFLARSGLPTRSQSIGASVALIFVAWQRRKPN